MEYKINDVVFLVHEYKVIKCTVKEIHSKITENETVTQYAVEPYDKARLLVLPGNALEKDFETAKSQAIANWERIDKDHREGFVTLTLESYREDEEAKEQRKKDELEKVKKANPSGG